MKRISGGHVIRHLSDALDEIRRSEYKRVTGDDKGYIKGQRYFLLSRRKNLSEDGRKNLERLLEAAKDPDYFSMISSALEMS